jgi:hypothetical protein
MDSRFFFFLAAILFVGADISPHEIPSVFLISKSENKNQVHFAVRLDEACNPATSAPVRPYWRMLERGPSVTEPLVDREERIYGIGSQVVEGSRVTVRLRALPARPIAIHTWRDENGSCHAVAFTSINGHDSRLFDVHVVLSMFGIEYVLVTGWDDSGKVVREKLSP